MILDAEGQSEVDLESDEVAAAALAALGYVSQIRLGRLLRSRSPQDLLTEVLSSRAGLDLGVAADGRENGNGGRQPSERHRIEDDPFDWWKGVKSSTGMKVTWIGKPDYPEALASDFQCPGVLYYQGDLSVVSSRPAVAIVGTRRATDYGVSVARHFGSETARAGLCVVSGLALGVDASAHLGAIQVEPSSVVAVVGSGCDHIYPRRNTRLWHSVAESGCLLSETPPGQAAQPWRFPARNRIIAALSRALVVVESHAAGGSMTTVEAALTRDRPVLAVPGSVFSSASSGCNALLRSGASPACDVQDLLVVLGLNSLSSNPVACSFEGLAGQVVDELAVGAMSFDALVEKFNVGPGELASHLFDLGTRGIVRQNGGWWALG